MKLPRRLAAAGLTLSMLLSLFGGGVVGAAAQTVTTDSELAFEPLAQTASVAYEQHEDGYTVSLDRNADSVTMHITAVPGNRAADKARLYIRTGVALRPGTAYQVSFSLSAEKAQPEYGVCFDGGSEQSAYGALDGRSIKAGGTDQVKYTIYPEEENGELILCLLLGNTEAGGNTLRFSNLTVGEAPEDEVGENVLLVDDLDYSAPGAIQLWTNTGSRAAVTSSGSSATMTVLEKPSKGAEVWEIQLKAATGFRPKPGKLYRVSVGIESPVDREFEVCYNEGDIEKGYDVLYGQRLGSRYQNLINMITVPEDKENPGELIIQLSLGKLQVGEKVTVSSIRVSEAAPSYKNALAKDFAFDRTWQSEGKAQNISGAETIPTTINWSGATSISAGGDYSGGLTVNGGTATLKINQGSQEVFDAYFQIDTAETLKAGAIYMVSYDINTAKAYPGTAEILCGSGSGQTPDKDYDALYGHTLNAGPNTVTHQITPVTEGGLLIKLQLGNTGGEANTVTLSGLTIQEVTVQPIGGNLADVTYPAAAGNSGGEPQTGSFYVRTGTPGSGTLTGNGSSVTMTCTGNTADLWERGLVIENFCDLESGRYQVSFSIVATKTIPSWRVCVNKDNDYADNGNNGNFFQKVGPELNANVSYRFSAEVPVEEAVNPILRIDLGNAPEGTKVTVSDVKVQKIKGVTSTTEDVTKPLIYPDNGSFSVRDYGYDGNLGYYKYYMGIITGDGSNLATMTCTQGPFEDGGWKNGLFIDDICNIEKDAAYTVNFNIDTAEAFNYEVHYWKSGDGNIESREDKIAQTAYGKSTGTNEFTDTITAKESGRLCLLIDLGLAPKDVPIKISNIQVIKNGTNVVDKLIYPNTSSFRLRKDEDKYRGTVTSNGNGSVTVTCTEPVGDGWKNGLYIDAICDITKDTKYNVKFDIHCEESFTYDVHYNDTVADYFQGENFFASAASGKQVSKGYFSETITAQQSGRLRLLIDLGNAPFNKPVTISNIKVEKVEESNKVLGTDISRVTYYPSESSGGSPAPSSSFAPREDGFGTVTGNGSSANMYWPSKEKDPNDQWKRALFINEISPVEAGKSYLVSFDILSDQNYRVRFFTEDKYDSGFTSGLAMATEPMTFKRIVTPEKGGKLTLRIDPTDMPNGSRLTISGIEVTEVATAGATTAIDSFSTSSVWTETSGGYSALLTRDRNSVDLAVSKAEYITQAATWKAKLYIDTGVPYEAGKAYRVSFNIAAEQSQKEFCAVYNTPNEDYRGKWEQTLSAGESKTIVSDGFPAGQGNVIVSIELGKLDGDYNFYTVKNVEVEEVELSYGIAKWVDGTVTCDTQPGYKAEIIREKDSGSVKITESPAQGAEAWKTKMFLNTDVKAWAGGNLRVTFDVLAEKDIDFEVCYNRDGKEREYGGLNALHAEGGVVKTVEKTFATKEAGALIVQLSIGLAQAPNTIKVSNLKVDRVTYSGSERSVMPTAFDYRAPGAVSYWAHEDYATDFTSSDDAITAKITQAPQLGAEPWKIKLFLDTGTVLQPGKYYRVTANVSAKASQAYEICYNNGGVEMGYDSMGGLQLSAGKAQTVEKIISVPADKTDATNLTLQFNLGKTNVPNEVAVSGVAVEEVSLSYADMMAQNFTYTGNSVGLWTNSDDTATLESSDNAATVHITNPSLADEVWKVKLFVNTGAILSPGKTYLVRADLLAAKEQNYEVCFNNEETEKGFDALYGQTITAGNTATVEKSISVPASMTDAGELILQFSVGGAVANDITVSNVSVQELNFGAGGSGNPAPDTVISLYNAPQTAAGTLDVTREKLTYKMTKISSAVRDNMLTVSGAGLRANDMYAVTFTARADQPLTGTFAFKQANGETTVISEPFKLTTEERAYSFTTKAPLSAGGFYDLLWQFGSEENQKLGSAEVELSHISVTCPAEALKVMRSAQKVTVNGKSATMDIYSINDYNYFKLRDLAMLLNDTDAQFVVRYNPQSNLVSLTTGKPYTPVGNELTVGTDQSVSCVRSPQDIAINGGMVNLKAYNIGGNNFFRLRDLNELLGFNVDYAAASNTVVIASPMTPEAQEKAHAYDIFFLPEVDGETQPYVGDTMPYYENGTYYIYYLKDGGDSYNHSVYLTTTKDFVTYTEYDDPVLSASREDVQDSWIGTGSVVKVEDTHYFFYTGYNASGSHEYHEKIMVAKSSGLTSFEKVRGWEIVPPDELGQKTDFRDPQAYYDPETQTISLTVTSTQGGTARILKYTLDKDLQNATYDGIIFTDPTGQFWNLECSDTFQIGDKWYLTYSGQEDTLWYAMADSRFGPYSNAARLDGKLFYAAKHVEDGTNSYMVGWARRANSASSTQEVAGWAGNVAVQKLRQQEDGTLALVPVDSIVSEFDTPKDLALGDSEATLTAGSGYSYKEAFTSYESFMLRGEFTYSGTGAFGLAFDFNGNEEQYKFISIDPAENKLSLSFNEGTTPITETQTALQPNQKYSFTYIQDGSVGIFYVDDQAALLVRLYGVTDKPIYLFAENNSVTFTSLRQYTR